MILATICTSLALYLGLGIDADPDMLDVMGTGDVAENDLDEEIAAQSVPPPATTTTTTQQPAFVKKSKKGVVDDWNADEDAIAAEENLSKEEVGNGTEGTDNEEYDKLMNVYKAFRKVKTEFDEKFKDMWA